MIYGRKGGELIGKEVEKLKNIAGVEFAAVIDDLGHIIVINDILKEVLGHAIATAGTLEKEEIDKLLAQTVTLYNIAKKSGENLNKGAVKEIYVIWEDKMGILKTLNVDYTLLVIASKDAIAWVRPAMKAAVEAILKIVGN